MPENALVLALGRPMGISHNVVLKWPRVPPLRVLEVEALTGIPRSVLRPDIYPPEREARVISEIRDREHNGAIRAPQAHAEVW